MPESLTASELVEKYPDTAFVDALTVLMDLKTLLVECLVAFTYRIPRETYEALNLTAPGDRLMQAIVKKGVKYPEARFMCYLRLLGQDILVDPIETDIEGLVAAVGEQIKGREIMFPFTYGRLLYDKLYGMGYRESHNVLTSAETMTVLDGTPQGVFQIGNLLTGPYGLLVAPQRRSIPPVREVPYHCPDLNCNIAHSRILVTSYQAEINKAQEIADKMLERERDTVSDWSGYFKHFAKSASDPYDDMAGDSVINLLGDALTLAELRLLVSWLLDHSNNKLRKISTDLGLKPGKAAQMVDKLDQAQLLQLALMVPDRTIGIGLDTLVDQASIPIASGEVRTPVINKVGRGVGWYGLRPELGRYGLRLVSPDSALALPRLRRLVAQMYRLDDEGDRAELEWQLRGEEVVSLEAKLEQFLQKRGPRQAVASLLLARKSNFIVASDRLGLCEDSLNSDDDRINAVMWKLGFSVEDVLDPHREFWNLHNRMVHVTRQSPINPVSVDAEKIRRHVLGYFVRLEDMLRDSLLFTTWALTFDHFASNRPFIYRPTVDEAHSLNVLRRAAASHGGGEHAVIFEEKLTLYPLMRGFQVLADHLDEVAATEKDYHRRSVEIPDWAARQDLQEFVFWHTVPYLDLLSESKELIARQLRSIGKRLVGAEVNEARNDWFHSRRTPIDAARLRDGLEAIREAVLWIEEGGFARQVYRRVRVEVDNAFRSTVILADARGQEVAFFRPNRFAWLDFPAIGDTQHVMLSARFAEPSEVLRFKSEAESPYSEMWRDYPVRIPNSSSDVGVHRSVGRHGE